MSLSLGFWASASPAGHWPLRAGSGWRPVARWLLISLAAFAAGGLRQSLLPQWSAVATHNGFSATVTGTVRAEPVRRAERWQLRLAAEEIFVNNRTAPTSGLVLVETSQRHKVRYGDRLRATGRLAQPATGDTFSYADYLARQNVFSIMRHAGLETLGRGPHDPLFARLLELKDSARRLIASALPEPQAGLLTGILLGDERGIAPELEEDFARVGAAHIIAISGFNMIVVSAVVMRVSAQLFPAKPRFHAASAVIVIGLYSIFVGANASILRAAAMSSLLVVGRQLNRRAFLPTSLACATLLLSLLDPTVLRDIGFQLSFCAVLGIGAFANPLSQSFRAWLERRLPAAIAQPLHNFLNEALIVSIAAQITTTPLIMLYFGRLSLVALPVSLLIVPVQTAVLLLGFLALLVYAILPALGTLLFWAELLCLSWTISIVRLFSQWQFAEITVRWDDRLLQLFYLLLIGGIMLQAARPAVWQRFAGLIRQRFVLVLTGATAAVLFILMLAMPGSRPDGQLHLWLLDLGHSNALLLQSPGGAQILVDGGRYPARLLTAIGDRLPFYDREIELLVIIQPDEWDIAALNSVLERYTIGAALYHGQDNINQSFREIWQRLKEAGTPIVPARAGYRIEFSDGLLLEALHPPAQPAITDKLNDQSLVLRLTYGAVSFLLLGDLSAAGQREMLAQGISPAATVMQIPQHGSARALDPAFLELAQPQLLLLQTDKANRRGDPDPDTLAQLEGLPLLRTDERGSIHLSTDGEEMKLNVY